MSRDNHPPVALVPLVAPRMESPFQAGLGWPVAAAALVLALDALPALVIIKGSLPPSPSIADLLLCFLLLLCFTARGTPGSGLSFVLSCLCP